LQKRSYILFVARGEDGQLRKIPIPLHYAYIFVAAAAIAILSMTGIASSYTRMLLKVSRFNQLRESATSRWLRWVLWPGKFHPCTD
jgi:hypothetical protein